MKQFYLTIAALFLVTALVIPGVATGQQTKKGNPPNFKEDKPESPEPEDPYVYFQLDCKTTQVSAQYAEQLGGASKYMFSGTVVNKTGKPITPSKWIYYSFIGEGSNGTSSYFLVNNTKKVSVSGQVYLTETIPPNGTLFLKNVQFITGMSPAKVTCSAYYKVKK